MNAGPRRTLSPRGRSTVWIGMLVALGMSSGYAIAQTTPIPVAPVTPADPMATALQLAASSPWAAVALYAIRVVDRWRGTMTDAIRDGARCLDSWRDDMREQRLGVTVVHRTED